ncbi:unnamed protein product [Cuscuta epithymum]|uniref:PB1-like domain-containing protein n=1 Tax=Cuscuta epithymum TaxID=186058 RepID=A0AAV0DVH9_9ASTE|nr:unnamed protein product [Cuscuta epithymum]
MWQTLDIVVHYGGTFERGKPTRYVNGCIEVIKSDPDVNSYPHLKKFLESGPFGYVKEMLYKLPSEPLEASRILVDDASTLELVSMCSSVGKCDLYVVNGDGAGVGTQNVDAVEMDGLLDQRDDTYMSDEPDFDDIGSLHGDEHVKHVDGNGCDESDGNDSDESSVGLNQLCNVEVHSCHDEQVLRVQSKQKMTQTVNEQEAESSYTAELHSSDNPPTYECCQFTLLCTLNVY